MKGYKVTLRYTTSIDVFVAADEGTPVDEIVKSAKDHVDTMNYNARRRELLNNIQPAFPKPYIVVKEN